MLRKKLSVLLMTLGMIFSLPLVSYAAPSDTVETPAENALTEEISFDDTEGLSEAEKEDLEALKEAEKKREEKLNKSKDSQQAQQDPEASITEDETVELTEDEEADWSEEDDTSEAQIFEKNVLIGGVEKTEKTSDITLRAVGFENLIEDNFDKEIYAIVRNANTYKRYGVILNPENNYEAVVTVPAGHYLLSKVGLTHGKAIDYFALVSEVICPPGSEKELEFNLYSLETEQAKAEEIERKAKERQQQAEQPVERVEIAKGPAKNIATVSAPEAPKKGNTIVTIISLAILGVIGYFYKKHKDEQKKKEEEL